MSETQESQAETALPDGRFPDVSDISQKHLTKHLSPKAHESSISDVSDVTDVSSGARGGKKLNSFLKTARPAPAGTMLRLWDPERQRQAAAKVRQGLAPSDDLLSGEEVEI